MDLQQFDTSKIANEGSVMEVLHPTTFEPLGVFIKVAGVDSDKYQQIRKRLLDKRAEILRRTRKMKLSADELEEESIQMLAECTLDWWEVDEDGKKSNSTITYGTQVKFSVENAKELYAKSPWIKEQVDEHMGDRENFLYKPSKSYVKQEEKK